MPRKYTEPRYIKPETVDIGDTIRVTYPENGGIEVSKVGTVASRSDHGQTRIMLTAEGGHLLAWGPELSKARVTLLARSPVNNDPQLPINWCVECATWGDHDTDEHADFARVG